MGFKYIKVGNKSLEVIKWDLCTNTNNPSLQWISITIDSNKYDYTAISDFFTKADLSTVSFEVSVESAPKEYLSNNTIVPLSTYTGYNRDIEITAVKEDSHVYEVRLFKETEASKVQSSIDGVALDLAICDMYERQNGGNVK